MGNIASGKKILEDYWVRPEELTNGNYLNYDGKNGYTYSRWPSYLTLDLNEPKEIETIRFLLYDQDNRLYKYRLLTSTDYKTWEVIFDTHNNGYKGWQEFIFPNKLLTKYIRLHCLWNSRNIHFHIIEMQVFDKETIDLGSIISNKIVITDNKKEFQKEIGVKLPLTEEMRILTKSLENIFINQPLLNSAPAQEIITKLELQANDIEKLEMSIDSIRREIINPVKVELEEGRKIGRFSVWGFYVGFAGIIISIFTILFNFISKILQ